MMPVFHLGKYAAFVWPAYAVSSAGIAAAVVLTVRAYIRAVRRLGAIERKP